MLVIDVNVDVVDVAGEDRDHGRLDEEDDEDGVTSDDDRDDDDDDAATETVRNGTGDDGSEAGTLRRTSLDDPSSPETDYDGEGSEYTESVADGESIAGDPDVVVVGA